MIPLGSFIRSERVHFSQCFSLQPISYTGIDISGNIYTTSLQTQDYLNDSLLEEPLQPFCITPDSSEDIAILVAPPLFPVQSSVQILLQSTGSHLPLAHL